jgi:hypothetical protein
MLEVSSNGIVTVNRGDSFTLGFRINRGSSFLPDYYELQPGDFLYFALMEPRQRFEEAVVRKAFTHADQGTDGVVSMTFEPKDTECLAPGKYYYTLKLRRLVGYDDGENELYEVETVRSKTQFTIID